MITNIEMKSRGRSFGFTLIELLVTITIIAILAALALTSYSAAQKAARDTRRKSDLEQYKNSLFSYATDHSGTYPGTVGGYNWVNASGGKDANTDGIFYAGVLTPTYIASLILPIDTGDSTSLDVYRYFLSDDGTRWGLYTGLEASGYWEICSAGRTGKAATLPSVAPYEAADGTTSSVCQPTQ